MPSFRTTITPSRQAAVHFVRLVRRQLQKALMVEKDERNLSQSEVARIIGVDRSVISREVNGTRDLTLGRLAELAYAMEREPFFEFRKIAVETDRNEYTAFHSSNEQTDVVGTISEPEVRWSRKDIEVA